MDTKKSILIFLGLTLLFSSAFWLAAANAGSINADGGLTGLWLMWSPGISAILVTFFSRRSLGELGLGRKIPWNYVALAFLLPAGYGLLVYGASWLTGWAAYSEQNIPETAKAALGGSTLLVVLASIVTYILPALGSALGEEIGWRGFLVPQLSKLPGFTFAGVSLLSGAVWALWHYPTILFTDYNAGTPVWFALPCFTVMVIAISFIFAWLTLKSRSIWPAAMLHASHNLFIQQIFDLLTKDTGITKYVTTEFGLGLALVLLALAVVFWVLRPSPAEIQPA
jgi:uncharacterized protein